MSTEGNARGGAAVGHRTWYSLLELLGREVSHPRDHVGLDSSLSEGPVGRQSEELRMCESVEHRRGERERKALWK